MTPADKDDVGRVGNGIHVAHPEDPEALIERQRLCPEGCFVLEGEDGRLLGYLLSHPWTFAAPPPLDSFLGSLPEHADSWYLHDLALLPETRGQGQALVIVERLADIARARGFATISLIAISGAHTFWARAGFSDYETPALVEKLRSYGDDAHFMVRTL